MTIREAIRLIAEQGDERMILATVSEVDDIERTCKCTPINGDAEILDVRLQTTVSGGVYLKPAEGSMVLVCMANETLGFVVLTSELDEVVYFDGSLGGIVKANELKTQLDKTNEVLQAVVDSLKNWVPVTSDGGAALKTFFNTTLGIKTVGDFTDIKNDLIKHGV
jgi:hypothetical protein